MLLWVPWLTGFMVAKNKPWDQSGFYILGIPGVSATYALKNCRDNYQTCVGLGQIKSSNLKFCRQGPISIEKLAHTLCTHMSRKTVQFSKWLDGLEGSRVNYSMFVKHCPKRKNSLVIWIFVGEKHDAYR